MQGSVAGPDLLSGLCVMAIRYKDAACSSLPLGASWQHILVSWHCAALQASAAEGRSATLLEALEGAEAALRESQGNAQRYLQVGGSWGRRANALLCCL